MATAAQELVERGESLKRDGIVIRTYDLWKTYVMGDQEIHAVSGVDVEIRRGEYVAIMGPSGSGKSTLMNLIGCLDSPTRGLYYLNGNLVSDMQDDELAHIRNKEIGFKSGPSARKRPFARWIWNRECITGRTSCRAAKGSAWRWRGPW